MIFLYKSCHLFLQQKSAKQSESNESRPGNDLSSSSQDLAQRSRVGLGLDRVCPVVLRNREKKVAPSRMLKSGSRNLKDFVQGTESRSN